MEIEIKVGSHLFSAVLNGTQTGKAIAAALPIEAKGNKWGDEIYFAIPLQLPLEDAAEIVEAGDLGYWPPGNAFCIFYGPTPASQGDEIRPASPVNVIGSIVGDLSPLKEARDRCRVAIRRIEE